LVAPLVNYVLYPPTDATQATGGTWPKSWKWHEQNNNGRGGIDLVAQTPTDIFNRILVGEDDVHGDMTSSFKTVVARRSENAPQGENEEPRPGFSPGRGSETFLLVGLIASYRKNDADVSRLVNLANVQGGGRARSEGLPSLTRAKQLRPTEIDRAIELYEQGASIVEIAKAFGVHRATMSERLRSYGVTIRHDDVTPELVEQAVELYRSGLSCAAIGKQLGFSGSTILTHLGRAGVRIRPRKGGIRKSTPG